MLCCEVNVEVSACFRKPTYGSLYTNEFKRHAKALESGRFEVSERFPFFGAALS